MGVTADDDPSSLAADGVGAEIPRRSGWLRPLGWLKRVGQFLFTLSFSSLTRRIVSLNIAGLLALVASILYLSQFRAGLIDARAQSLLVQAEIDDVLARLAVWQNLAGVAASQGDLDPFIQLVVQKTQGGP